VAAILVTDYNYDGSTSLAPFISTATALVDYIEDHDPDSLMTATLLERVEAFLAAHFYAHADQLYQNKSTGGASGGFQGHTQMVFLSTQYGQTACALDLTGFLAKRSKEVVDGAKQKVQIGWLGTDAEDVV
jgi:hypothetical protein